MTAVDLKDTGEELRARLRILDAERIRLLNAIKAYDSSPNDSGISMDGLDLTDLTVKDAVVELLKHAAANGQESMSAGEIESILRNFRVRTSRGGKLANSETKGLWVTLNRVLGAPGNTKHFTVQRSTEGHIIRTDRVLLAKPPPARRGMPTG